MLKNDLILALRSQIFEYLHELLYRHAFKHLEPAPPENMRNSTSPFPTERPDCAWPFVKTRGRPGQFFDASISSGEKLAKMLLIPSSTVYGGQYDTAFRGSSLGCRWLEISAVLQVEVVGTSIVVSQSLFTLGSTAVHCCLTGRGSTTCAACHNCTDVVSW